MSLSDMLTYGPVHMARWKGQFRCVWTPLNRDNTFSLHGIGVADQPTTAIVAAVSDAKQKGWIEP